VTDQAKRILSMARDSGVDIVVDRDGVLPFEQSLPEGVSGPKRLINCVLFHDASVLSTIFDRRCLLVTADLYAALMREGAR
jgi:hypothetical protein